MDRAWGYFLQLKPDHKLVSGNGKGATEMLTRTFAETVQSAWFAVQYLIGLDNA